MWDKKWNAILHPNLVMSTVRFLSRYLFDVKSSKSCSVLTVMWRHGRVGLSWDLDFIYVVHVVEG